LKNLLLTPLKIQKQSRINFAAADCESMNSKSAKFRCGSIAFYAKGGKGGGRQICTETYFSRADFFNRLSQFKVTYFFNLNYDSSFLKNHAFDSKDWAEFEISAGKGQRLLGIKFTRKSVKQSFIVKDIIQFVQGKLSKSCAEYGILEKKYPDIPDTEDGDNPAWEEFFDNATDEEIKKHCEQDCKMLLLLVSEVRRAWWENFSTDICKKRIYSLPSAAMVAYRMKFIQKPIENPFFLLKYQKGKKPEIIIREKIEQFCREAYKGGFCNAESTDIYQNLLSFDVISEYPFAMKALRFPTGTAKWTKDETFFLNWCMYIPGIAKCVFFYEGNEICGVREGKLCRLQGKFTETLTSIEIYWILSHGGRIVEFLKGVVFSDFDRHNSLMRYENFCLKLKTSSTGGKRQSAKIAANSLYGKTGQKYRQKSKNFVYYTREEFDDKTLESKEKIIGYQILENGIIAETESESISPKPFMNVVWAALISAFGRIYLLSNAQETNSKYEDTDSLKIPALTEQFRVNVAREIPDNLSKELQNKMKYQNVGFFEYEYTFTEFRALAPKMYAGTYLDKGVIKQLVKIKGVPYRFRKQFLKPILEGQNEFHTGIYLKIMGRKEGLHAKHYEDKDGAFGGLRLTKKDLMPEKKLVYYNDNEWR